MNKTKADTCCNSARQIIEKEAQALLHMAQQIGADFYHACKLLCQCEGKVIVMGMGKSGHIGQKIAATLASTGTAAFFIHPGEASHGDLGMIGKNDILLMISNSGNSQELTRLLPYIKQNKIPLIVISNVANSRLGRAATICLLLNVTEEACPLGLAPTTSSTNTLALGDALAICCLLEKKFSKQAFAQIHPAGTLGKRLNSQALDIMRCGQAIPQVRGDSSIADALIEMTNKQLGMTCIIDSTGALQGVFTDGDLRRCLSNKQDIHKTPIISAMNKNFKSIQPEQSAIQALAIMHEHKITSLVVQQQQRIVGIVHMHDLLYHGIASKESSRAHHSQKEKIV